MQPKLQVAGCGLRPVSSLQYSMGGILCENATRNLYWYMFFYFIYVYILYNIIKNKKKNLPIELHQN